MAANERACARMRIWRPPGPDGGPDGPGLLTGRYAKELGGVG